MMYVFMSYDSFMKAMTFMLVYAVIGQDSLRLIQGSQAVLKKWSRSTIVAVVSPTHS